MVTKRNQTSEKIIKLLQAIPKFEDRYTGMKCINFDPENPENREGNFSLIFSAFDSVLSQKVILKFFDPGISDVYRLNCFKREATILDFLKTKKRCLKIIQPIKIYSLEINKNDGLIWPLQYFITEYLPIKIITRFYKPPRSDKLRFDTLNKLKLFRHILKAVDALHRVDIFHRDLKPDNLMGTKILGKLIVKAIDLGTASQVRRTMLSEDYGFFYSGASGYTSPEALMGFSGERKIVFYNDFYALGCIFYELFEKPFFFHKLQELNNNYFDVIENLRCQLSAEEVTLTNYHKILDSSFPIFDFPKLTQPEFLRKPVVAMMNEILRGLIEFDYRKRINNFFLLQSKINLCITIIEKESEYDRLLDFRRKKALLRNSKNSVFPGERENNAI